MSNYYDYISYTSTDSSSKWDSDNGWFKKGDGGVKMRASEFEEIAAGYDKAKKKSPQKKKPSLPPITQAVEHVFNEEGLRLLGLYGISENNCRDIKKTKRHHITTVNIFDANAANGIVHSSDGGFRRWRGIIVLGALEFFDEENARANFLYSVFSSLRLDERGSRFLLMLRDKKSFQEVVQKSGIGYQILGDYHVIKANISPERKYVTARPVTEEEAVRAMWIAGIPKILKPRDFQIPGMTILIGSK